MKLKNTLTAGVFALAAAAVAGPANGTVVFTGSGLGEDPVSVSGSASFTLTGTTLTLILANTTGSPTPAQGDTITGLVFSINGLQTLSFAMSGAGCGPTLGAGSNLFTGVTTTNNGASLCGSWTNALAATPTIPAEFGVGTTGWNNGTTGEFIGGSITLGNASPDYGIVAPGTFPIPPGPGFGGSKFPFAQNELVFQFTLTSGSFSESDITGVNFLVGTDGTKSFEGCNPCTEHESPEPDSLALLGFAGLLLAFTARRRALS